MSPVAHLGQEVRCGLEAALPGIRKTVLKKMSLVIGALIEGGSPNTAELSNLVPLETERSDMREQWLRRLLKNPLVDCHGFMAPFARWLLAEAGSEGRVIELLMDQTEIGHRFAILMVGVRVGDRALPLAWEVSCGADNLGFASQSGVLEQVAGWLPAEAKVLLLADRFYPSVELFRWLKVRGWGFRLRLKGNYAVDVGDPQVSCCADLAAGVRERYEPCAWLFEEGVEVAIGVVHDRGHKEPWIIAMDDQPCRATVMDYADRWAIEPMFSDFKSRGFDLSKTQLRHPERLSRLILMMALAMIWCVQTGRHHALAHPTPTEKKPGSRTIPTIGAGANYFEVPSPGSKEDFAF